MVSARQEQPNDLLLAAITLANEFVQLARCAGEFSRVSRLRLEAWEVLACGPCSGLLSESHSHVLFRACGSFFWDVTGQVKRRWARRSPGKQGGRFTRNWGVDWRKIDDGVPAGERRLHPSSPLTMS